MLEKKNRVKKKKKRACRISNVIALRDILRSIDCEGGVSNYLPPIHPGFTRSLENYVSRDEKMVHRLRTYIIS